jgi:hypothetical protein
LFEGRYSASDSRLANNHDHNRSIGYACGDSSTTENRYITIQIPFATTDPQQLLSRDCRRLSLGCTQAQEESSYSGRRCQPKNATIPVWVLTYAQGTPHNEHPRGRQIITEM